MKFLSIERARLKSVCLCVVCVSRNHTHTTSPSPRSLTVYPVEDTQFSIFSPLKDLLYADFHSPLHYRSLSFFLSNNNQFLFSPSVAYTQQLHYSHITSQCSNNSGYSQTMPRNMSLATAHATYGNLSSGSPSKGSHQQQQLAQQPSPASQQQRSVSPDLVSKRQQQHKDQIGELKGKGVERLRKTKLSA